MTSKKRISCKQEAEWGTDCTYFYKKFNNMPENTHTNIYKWTHHLSVEDKKVHLYIATIFRRM